MSSAKNHQAAYTPVGKADQEHYSTGISIEDGVRVVGVDGENWTKGEKQQNAFRDVLYAVLFYIQLAIVGGVAFVMGPAALSDLQASTSTNDETTTGTSTTSSQDIQALTIMALNTIFISGTASIIIASLCLYLMTRYSQSIVRIAFVVSPLFFVFFGLICFATGDPLIQFFGIMWFAVAIFSVCLWFYYKSHMPFAAANLHTALTATASHTGVYATSIVMALLVYGWTILWTFAAVAVFNTLPECTNVDREVTDPYTGETQTETSMECPTSAGQIYLVLLLISYYWTQQVIMNVCHVTVAGTVGTWWFDPLSTAGCCSEAVRDSLFRSLTYSFGSICLGSLLVALLETAENLLDNARRHGDNNAIKCIIECILVFLRSLLEYFNSWAYVYVGLYGYGYFEAGSKVMELFKQRGWTTFISDRLVFRVLLLMNFICAGFTGLVAVLMDAMMGGPANKGVAFTIGFFIGYFVGIIVFSVVESAVRTAIVCFAEGAQELDAHHPELASEMKRGWMEAYPTVGDF